MSRTRGHRFVLAAIAVAVAMCTTRAHAAFDLVSFVETSSNVELAVDGDNFNFSKPRTITKLGAFWDVVVTFNPDGANKMKVEGTARHVLGPHDDDGIGGDFYFTAAGVPSTLSVVPSSGQTDHPNSHVDSWSLTSCVTTGSDPSSVTGWNLTLEGTHEEGCVVIPEPTTMAVWSVLGFAGLGAGWWRRRRS